MRGNALIPDGDGGFERVGAGRDPDRTNTSTRPTDTRSDQGGADTGRGWFNLTNADDEVIAEGGSAGTVTRLRISGSGPTSRYRVEGEIVGSKKMGGVDDPGRGVFGVAGGTDVVDVRGPYRVIQTSSSGAPSVSTETLSTGAEKEAETRSGVRATDASNADTQGAPSGGTDGTPRTDATVTGNISFGITEIAVLGGILWLWATFS
jgi:hypothetical protein